MLLSNTVDNNRSRNNFTYHVLTTLREMGTTLVMEDDQRTQAEIAKKAAPVKYKATKDKFSKAKKGVKEGLALEVIQADLAKIQSIEKIVGDDGEEILNPTPEQRNALQKQRVINLVEDS